jgi:hypothetical protein
MFLEKIAPGREEAQLMAAKNYPARVCLEQTQVLA